MKMKEIWDIYRRAEKEGGDQAAEERTASVEALILNYAKDLINREYKGDKKAALEVIRQHIKDKFQLKETQELLLRDRSTIARIAQQLVREIIARGGTAADLDAAISRLESQLNRAASQEWEMLKSQRPVERVQ